MPGAGTENLHEAAIVPLIGSALFVVPLLFPCVLSCISSPLARSLPQSDSLSPSLPLSRFLPSPPLISSLSRPTLPICPLLLRVCKNLPTVL